MLISTLAFSQVGVNTDNPTVTFDIAAKNATGTSTNVDGLLVPKVSRERAQSMSNVPTSTLIYVNSIANGSQTGTALNIDAVGYYYFDGQQWLKLNVDASKIENIYNTNGTLTGNRTVTLADKTLTFNTTAVNGFNVAKTGIGYILSVDGSNQRVGFGTTTPQNKIDMGNDAPSATNDPAGKKLAVYNTSTASSFYGLGVSSNTLQIHAGSAANGEPGMVLTRGGNAGIGAPAPNASAILELASTSKGFLPPRMTTAQRDAINPKPAGLTIYNTSTNILQFWNGTSWINYQ
ncbi:hypothetical protein [Chryseobacterium wanjuense]